jgi:OmpA-OmpF porin, OOP family
MRKFLLPSSAAIAIAASSTVASAQTAEGFAVNRFEPSERGSEWFAGDTLDLRGSFRPALGVVGDYSYRSLAVYRPDGEIDKSPVRNMLFAHLGGSLVLWDRVRLAASLPIQAFADGHTGTVAGNVFLPPPNEQGVGDLRLGADVRLFGEYGDVITGAVGLQVWVPTGDRDQYTSDGKIRIRPRAMVAGDVGILAYSAQLNVAYRDRSETIADGAIGSDLGFIATAGVRVLDKKLLLGPEFYGSTVLDDAFAKRTTPIEGILGGHYTFGDDFRAGAGIGTGLTRGWGSPEVRALVSFEWVPAAHVDTDGDGIEDKDDACPTQAGVKSDDPKKNGCPAAEPPPADRDHDGILDKDDACPDVAGVKTDDPQTNGCPPAPPPPLDTDGDGVLDKDDACPTVAGLKTQDPKTNGCPDPDRDKDGVPNDTDACPDEPGAPDPDPKKNGCPKAFVSQGQIKILDQVKFKTASAEIEKGKDSEDILQAVLKVMNDHPEIKKVRVEGHTDNRGDANMNKKLSTDRAASVVKWLVAHGVDKARLTSAGFGKDKPIDDNNTEDGRRNNRRVEFHIEENK